MQVKRRFFASHAKSSAMVVSLAIHGLVLLLALSFVAVRVIIKDEQSFESKPVSRPRAALKKLQVPVNVKRQQQKPKLRKRIVAAPKLNRTMPDIKMPEVSGFKGGMGSAGDTGLGGAGGVGFSMPEINVFGVKSRGEKIFLILDSTSFMMFDEMGGIPAYTIIKNELVKMLEGLSPAVLFNIAVYDRGSAHALFPQMAMAAPGNVAKVEAWLKPLNAVWTNMGDKDYGVRTLGPGSIRIGDDFSVGKLERVRQWNIAAMLAMKEQADAVFVLTEGWGELFHNVDHRNKWDEDSAKMKKWRETLARAEQRHAEENEERRRRGQPPRVLSGPYVIVETYFPGTEQPPVPERYWYNPREVAEAMRLNREKWKPEPALAERLSKRRERDNFTVNVVHFVRTDIGAKERDEANLRAVTSLTGGSYRTLAGLEAIRSAAR